MVLKYTMLLKEVRTGNNIQIKQGTKLKYIKRIRNGHLLRYNEGTLYCNVECTDEQYRNMIK